MARLIGGMASSHAFALDEPERWDEVRQTNRQMYARRYGVLPPEQPGVAEETDDVVAPRYARIRDAFTFIRRKLERTRPDALILVGDDQNEHFTDTTFLPQISIYLGEEFLAADRGFRSEPVRYRSASGLAATIFDEAVESGVDMVALPSFPEGKLVAHAFGPVLRKVDPEARIPVIPIFINAVRVPAPPPPRCYAYGQAIRRAVERYAGDGRVVIYASGGLSHFTAGYPYSYYQGPFTYGSISEEFDRWLIARMQAGEGHVLGELTNRDIIGNGEIELRNWITMLGAIGDARPELLVYEPFYRGILGMGVGCWELGP